MQDLISRKAAIDEIRKCRFVVDAIEKIIGLPSAQPEPQWIPVKERLPEEETDVLICNSTGNIEISRGSYSTEASDWIWYTSGWRFGKVIAWMPLPTAYREDGGS